MLGVAGTAVVSGGDVAARAAAHSHAPPGAQDLPASSAAAERVVAELRDPILRISREVWAAAELSLVEQRSHAIHLR
jgi:hypothetical protein